MDMIDAARNINKSHETDTLNRLYTPFGEALDAAHILEEYPRPQLRREHYTNLNGYWNYAFTDSPHFPSSYDGHILVPFSPESLLSGVERQLQPDEYLWYERTLSISEEEWALASAHRLLLHFGAVDQSAAVYVNGEELCSHNGGYLPFEVELTPHLHRGDNSLLVRVQDATDTSWHSRGKQTLKRGGMFYTAQSGIWQTVWTEWVPENYIRRLKLTPDFDKGQIEIGLWADRPASVTVQIIADPSFSEKNGSPKEGRCIYDTFCSPFSSAPDTLTPDTGTNRTQEAAVFTIQIRLPELHPWSPDSPFLYGLRLQFGEDRIDSYFALRTFTIEPDSQGIMRFCLNHRPLFLHGVLDQGYWPDGLYTAPSDEALLYDIRTMKKLGFNMLRKHIKIESARWYYHCDRLGMIVWQDMVSGGSRYSMPMVCYLPTLFPRLSGRMNDGNYKLFSRHSKEGREEWLKECLDTVDYLYNVPSIAVWVPFNEGWGQFDANSVTALINEKDPTRPVDQTSGWFDQNGGDFKSVHNYFRKLKVMKDPRAFVLSEYGGYACRIQGHSSVERIYGYRKFDTPESFSQAYCKLIGEEIRPLIEKGLCGAVYTQVSDVEEEVNGLLTYDRRVCKLLPGYEAALPS